MPSPWAHPPVSRFPRVPHAADAPPAPRLLACSTRPPATGARLGQSRLRPQPPDPVRLADATGASPCTAKFGGPASPNPSGLPTMRAAYRARPAPSTGIRPPRHSSPPPLNPPRPSSPHPNLPQPAAIRPQPPRNLPQPARTRHKTVDSCISPFLWAAPSHSPCKGSPDQQRARFSKNPVARARELSLCRNRQFCGNHPPQTLGFAMPPPIPRPQFCGTALPNPSNPPTPMTPSLKPP